MEPSSERGFFELECCSIYITSPPTVHQPLLLALLFFLIRLVLPFDLFLRRIHGSSRQKYCNIHANSKPCKPCQSCMRLISSTLCRPTQHHTLHKTRTRHEHKPTTPWLYLNIGDFFFFCFVFSFIPCFSFVHLKTTLSGEPFPSEGPRALCTFLSRPD